MVRKFSLPLAPLLVVLGASVFAVPVRATHQPADPPPPREIQALEAYPSKLELKGRHDARQLLVSATLADGRVRDLTGLVPWKVIDPSRVTISERGRVLPLSDGDTEIVAELAGKTVRVPVRVTDCAKDLAVNFPNQVVPIFTKLGCNSGGCHGKQSGQNGFRLSLLGFDPALDHETLVHEAKGRRVFVPSAENSLLLRKGTAQIAHGGGRKLDPESDEYDIIRRWIAAGASLGRTDEAVLARIRVHPERGSLESRGRQQLAAFAEYSDGAEEDVTRRALYESNDPEVAKVDAEGLVRAMEQSGEAAVMVRYQGQVAVYRAAVPLGKPAPDYDFTEQTVVDRHVRRKWRELGLVPSELCSDAQFLRRASLDITGTLPSPEDVRAFEADNDPRKRAKLVDRLVDSDEYADLFAHKWADILRVSRRGRPSREHGTFAFHDWIRQAVAADLPYNEFTRAILTAVGDESRTPPTVWYKEFQTPEQLADDAAQVFLGMRIACAQCHHHPYEKWSQDDYWGLAAFFGRVKRKVQVELGVADNGDPDRFSISIAPNGNVTNKRTKRAAQMKPLDGTPIMVAPEEDPRQKLADWMTDPQNPFFARAIANRYWAHFFGRGIVDPIDDMRVTNPPSNPELLDALAAESASHGYSNKHLIRTICNSRAYQLSSAPNDYNRSDKHSYARYYPKRLSAEVLYDALTQVLGGRAQFAGLPSDTYAPRRAVMLPDESFQSYFLDVFGRPQRISACECERVAEANLAQVLHLLNSNEVQSRLSNPDSRAGRLAKDARPDSEKIEELFFWAFAHGPKPEQLEAALAHLAAAGADKKAAYENILWSLINTKEFSFNQ
jgi:Protein of unknown function (DUF1553)/Protein of unknown function (DUF1549)